MADRKVLSNDTYTAPQGQGLAYQEEVFVIAFNESSVHTAATVTLQGVAGPMSKPGRITDFVIGVVATAVSASGFVSATVTGDVRINSAPVCSTAPSIPGPVGSAGAAIRIATNSTFTSAAGKPAPVSAVINAASANFSAGDMISMDYTIGSAGSAAAGTAGKGFYGQVTVRYAAQ